MTRYDDREPRGSGGGWFWWLVILLAVGAGIYWFWFRGADTNYKFKITDLPTLIKNAPQVLKELKVQSEELTGKAWKATTKTPKDVAGAILEDIGKSAVDSFKEQAANILGVAPNLAPHSVAIVRPVRTLLSLLLEAASDEGLTYAIDWGDNKKARGGWRPKNKRLWNTNGRSREIIR